MKRFPKILLLSCGTGEGHNSAAFALAAALKDDAVCEVRDVLVYKSEKAVRRVTRAYSRIVRRIPKFFGILYTLGKVYDELHLPSPLYACNAVYAKSLARAIEEEGYDAVVCTHLFAMEAMTAARRRDGCTVPCFGVMTDYTMHPFVKDTALDGYFVPTERVAEQFFRKKIAREKVFVTGIPVHPKFCADIPKECARERLGIPADKRLVVILSGGAGVGHLGRLCKRIAKRFDDTHLFAVLTGRNEKLRAALDETFSACPTVRTIPFTPDVHLWLRAADVAVSKAGGLSSTEIAAVNVPLVHLNAVPGLESVNLRWFAKNGMSLRSSTCGHTVGRIGALLSDPVLAQSCREAQRAAIDPHAARRVSEIVLDKLARDAEAPACAETAEEVASEAAV